VALREAFDNAEKLGQLMCPRPSSAWGEQKGFDHHHLPYVVSGSSVRPVQAVARFANKSSVVKTCLSSLVKVLYASRSFLFSPETGVKGSKGCRNSIGLTSMLLRYLDGFRETHESKIPVNSSSLEKILRKACQVDEAAVSTPGASVCAGHGRPGRHGKGTYEEENELEDLVTPYSIGWWGEIPPEAHVCCDEEQPMDMGYYKEIADMVAFGWASTNSEREAHFDWTKALHRRGTLTRNMACIDLVELGLRNASS